MGDETPPVDWDGRKHMCAQRHLHYTLGSMHACDKEHNPGQRIRELEAEVQELRGALEKCHTFSGVQSYVVKIARAALALEQDEPAPAEPNCPVCGDTGWQPDGDHEIACTECGAVDRVELASLTPEPDRAGGEAGNRVNLAYTFKDGQFVPASLTPEPPGPTDSEMLDWLIADMRSRGDDLYSRETIRAAMAEEAGS